MIRIAIAGQYLLLNEKQIVTFKKSQNLNGVSDLFSYSNNFPIPKNSFNSKIINATYLPTSKGKFLAKSIIVDMVLSDCIFLKNQILKISSEDQNNYNAYIIYSGSNFENKAKNFTLNTIDFFEGNYSKTLSSFLSLNGANPNYRTSQITQQDIGGFLVIEESQPLINIKYLFQKLTNEIGYRIVGDFHTDVDFPKYFTSANSSIYDDTDSVAKSYFDPSTVAYEVMINILVLFNAYVTIDETKKVMTFGFWKNIDKLRINHKDYTNFYLDFTSYGFKSQFAKSNTMEYATDNKFFNSYFSLTGTEIDSFSYLKSNFGAGVLKFFSNSTFDGAGAIVPRTDKTIGAKGTMNIFVFTGEPPVSADIYYNNTKSTNLLNVAKSPNILQIYNEFHALYVKNVSNQISGEFKFRYDSIFLHNFKMNDVFFIKNISSYWLPTEINYASNKKNISIKALMIQKVSLQSPLIFDATDIQLNFNETKEIPNFSIIYDIRNQSPMKDFIVLSFDQLKTRLWVKDDSGLFVEVVSLPTIFPAANILEIKVENIHPINEKISSYITYQAVSQEGQNSNVARVKITTTGIAYFKSDFYQNIGDTFSKDINNQRNWDVHFNTSLLVKDAQGNLISNNIPVTLEPAYGEMSNLNAGNVLNFSRAMANVKVTIFIGRVRLWVSNLATGRDTVSFDLNLDRNGVFEHVFHSFSAQDAGGSANEVIQQNISRTYTFNANANDVFRINCYFKGRSGRGDMHGVVEAQNINWSFSVTETL
jgi:hypothetical protein